MPNRLKAQKNGEVVRIQATLDWKYGQDKATGKWVAICDCLGLTVQEDSVAELHKSMAIAADDMFHELIISGDFEAFLKARKWSYSKVQNKARSSGVEVDVPWNARRASARDLESCAC